MRKLILFAAIGLIVAAVTPARADAAKKAEAPPTEKQLLESLGADLPNIRLDAAKALGAKGESALPKLLERITSDDWRVRRAVVDALMAMGEASKPAVPALITALDDKNAWVRDGAAEALGKTGDNSPKVVSALAKACNDDDPWVRYMAGQSLMRVTKEPDILVPAAINMLNKPDRFGRGRGVGVGLLKKYGKGYEEVVPTLIRMIDEPSEGMFSPTGSAVDALLAVGADDQLIVDALVRLAQSKWWAHRSTAYGLLAKLGDKAKSTLPMLREMADKDPHYKSRKAAENALKQLTQPATPSNKKKRK